MFTIYRIRNKVTNQSYVGQTAKPLQARMAGHRAFAARGMTYPLATAIRQFGWDSFEVTEINRVGRLDEAKAMERAAITLFKTLAPHGYNLSPDGGSGYVRSDSTRHKQRLARLGKPGHIPSVESRRKMSASRSGANNWRARAVEYQSVTYPCIKDLCLATSLSRQQVYRRIALGLVKYLQSAKPNTTTGHWNKGRHRTEAERAKMSAAHRGGQNWNARHIEVDGVVYPSQKNAYVALGITKTQLNTRLKRGTARLLTAARHISKEHI